MPADDRALRETQDSFTFKAVGPVTVNGPYQFTIDLGYPLPYTQTAWPPDQNGIRVVTWPEEHGAWDTEVWSVWGYIERLRFGTGVPLMVWTDMNHCQEIVSID